MREEIGFEKVIIASVGEDRLQAWEIVEQKSTPAITATLIGERSAGQLAIHIYEDGELVYSHDYFANGASEGYYQEVIKAQAWDDMVNSADWRNYDGCDRDENGDVVDYDSDSATLETIRFTPATGAWDYLGSDTMSNDFIAANAHRLPAGVVKESGIIKPEAP